MAPTIKKIVKTTSKENSRENSWRNSKRVFTPKKYEFNISSIRVAGQAIYIGLLTTFLALLGKLKKN